MINIKQPKKLTREQKEIVANNNLITKEWMFADDLGSYLKIIHKNTGKIKLIDKYKKKVR
ncbi:hypothetical protein CG709_20570 [Lachnotalea glycerini]|uniref:DUF6906 family protein n=1 Tax=Lachnotalea glycerini TaxID=1763509 RepID=UPI000BC8A318|nr:hypothetical protein [Lachnotalea glycerini]OYO43031.1 hypothetical protein CG709_20570 [Lachnotalea glycerini]